MKIRKNLNVIIMLIIVLLPFIYYGNIIFSGKMLYGTDWIDAGGYIKRAFVENAQDRYGEFPLWNPNVFTGIPTGEGFLGDIFYPISLFLKLFLPLFIAWTLIFVIHPVFAGIGMYLFIKEKIKNRWIGLFAAIVYMFTSVILSETYAGHDGRVIVACYLPLLIYFLDRGFHMKRIGYFGIASLIASLMLLSGHIQSSYYAIVLGIFYISFIHINNEYKHRFRNYTWLAALLIGFLFSFIDRYVGFGAFVLLIIFSPILLDREFQRTSVKIYGGLLLFIILTAVISAVQYMPILRYLPYTARGLSRGYSYATSWSMGLSEIVDMVFPGFTGITQEGMNSYWGANPFKLHFRYIGIIPMLLALSAIFLKKKSAIEKFMIISFFTGIIIALGGDTPIYRI
ncbi:MAG: hypothetical protein SVK54_02750, partial [candidate division WOR-3 bacterium]|nr:hypothetical protein [candidate division WOR-3 bacterium]